MAETSTNMIEKSYNVESCEATPQDIKVEVAHLTKMAKKVGIPIFIAYKDPQKGYAYNGVFPEEIDDPSACSEYGKFIEFMRVCSDFNKNSLGNFIKIS